MSRWNQRDDVPRGATYDERWERLAAAGADVHGEVAFVERLVGRLGLGRRVLDAGCGTGRVAIELARRGYEVVGTDLDERMLDHARAKAPGLTWVHADLAHLDLADEPFDVVVMAGNVMIFVAPGTEAVVLARLAAHLRTGGAVVAGFSLRPDGLDADRYDALAAQVGLEPIGRFATWDEDRFTGGDYLVSVHRSPMAMTRRSPVV